MSIYTVDPAKTVSFTYFLVTRNHKFLPMTVFTHR